MIQNFIQIGSADTDYLSTEISAILNNYLQTVNNKGEIQHIPINDILYIDMENETFEMVTKTGTFKAFLPVQVLNTLLENYRFADLDRHTIVNVDKIVKYDSVDGILYFDDENEKLCLHVSLRKLAKVAKNLDKDKDICYLKKTKKSKITIFV